MVKMLGLLSLSAGPDEIEKLEIYLSLIRMGSRRHRLVGDRDAHHLIYKHFYDSLYPLQVMKFERGPLLDLGTGVGLPGIPLKIFLPALPIYLLDSNRRRIAFVKHVCQRLGLEDLFFLEGRAEHFAGNPRYRESFQHVISRAVARSELLAEMTLPFTAVGGRAVWYKGPTAEEEILQASAGVRLLGGQVGEKLTYRLPTGEKRVLIVIDKVAVTPPQYPRQANKWS